MFHEMAYQVQLDNGDTKDIIAFYNHVFIKRLKMFFVELPNKTPDQLFGNINNQYLNNSNTSNNVKPNSSSSLKNTMTGDMTQIKANKLANKKPTRSLIPEDILQSPLNKLLSSPFMGTNSNMNMNSNNNGTFNNSNCLGISGKSKQSSGSPIGSIGLNSRDSGSNKSKTLANKMIPVKHSPSFFGHDINYDNTLRQSGNGSSGNRNQQNYIQQHIRGTINSKKVINFNDVSDDNDQRENQFISNGNQSNDIGIRERDSNCQSPNINDKVNYFSHDGYKDNEDYYSKKFAMMIPGNKPLNPQQQQKANKSNENPPTYQKCFDVNNHFKF